MSQIATASDLSRFVSDCGDWLRTGQINRVRETLSALNFAQIPRPHKQEIAKLCRRAGLVTLGLRCLYPIVRHRTPLDRPPSDGEICEYAVLLSRNGSISEALDLLRRIPGVRYPESILYQGFCQISSWDYGAATELLEQFISLPGDDYTRLVARVNLASCYLAEENFKVLEGFVDETIGLAQEAKAMRLLGNAYEIRGQMRMLNGRFDQSRQDLRSALSIFGESQIYDQLLIKKGFAILEALESQTEEPLLMFRKEALERKHWESVREVDFNRLKIRFDPSLFDHLHYGTRFGAYKKRLERVFHHQPNETYLIGEGVVGDQILDLSSLEGDSTSDLRFGGTGHRLLATLCGDLYAPFTLGELFGAVYPGEYFDVDSSPGRVRQQIRRLRAWLTEHHPKVSVGQRAGGYFMALGEAAFVRIRSGVASLTEFQRQMANLQVAMGPQRLFTVKDACQSLGVSRSSFHRLAEWGQNHQKIVRTGVGKATRYKIAS